MSRISRDAMFTRIAAIIAERSTCPKLHVGSVLVKDRRIISTGYNGAPSETPHCDEDGCMLAEDNKTCIRTVHAEANVIAFAAKNGIATDGATLYSTHGPCYTCSKLLVNAGIKKLVYVDDYRISEGLRLLTEAGIEVEKYVATQEKMP